MSPAESMLVALVISLGAGVLGSLLGLGGGIIVVPALTIILKVDIRYAIAASIVSVIATSSGSAASYVRRGLSNIRLGMFLEVGSSSGAICGAYMAGVLGDRWLYVIFGVVLVLVAIQMLRRQRDDGQAHGVEDRLADRLALHGGYHDPSLDRDVEYRVCRTPLGLGISGLAGIVAGLLGVGGGVMKVPLMNLAMGVPLKAASATSNFMIGVTAAAAAGLYFARGDIDPLVTAPVAVGVLIGSAIGSRMMRHVHGLFLRRLFVAVLAVTAAEMLWKGLK